MVHRPTLRLNEGDPSEARVYYAAHLVAAALGFFAQEGVDVASSRTASGGADIRGGQIPALLDGTADVAIGGPMVTMRLREDGGARLQSFCAAAAANPWVLAARSPEPGFALPDLRHRRVLDMAGIGTATFAFRRVLARAGLGADAVAVLPSRGDAARDLASLEAGHCDYLLHSLHALGDLAADGRLAVVADLAAPTGPVPWSAYIAAPERIDADRPAFEAFTRAIGRALAWIAAEPARAVADLVAPSFPGFTSAGLAFAIETYRRSGVFAASPLVARDDFDRFGALLVEAGWLSRAPSYDALVETGLATAAMGGRA